MDTAVTKVANVRVEMSLAKKIPSFMRHATTSAFMARSFTALGNILPLLPCLCRRDCHKKSQETIRLFRDARGEIASESDSCCFVSDDARAKSKGS